MLSLGLDSTDYWIGANDTVIDGHFEWLNGDGMTYGSPYWAIFGFDVNTFLQVRFDQQISSKELNILSSGTD